MKKVLFICIHNSARSQMAEGLLNHYSNGKYSGFSAGTKKTTVHPLATEVMSELEIDIKNQFSKQLDYYAAEKFDIIITVCDSASKTCPPYPPGIEVLHWPLQDPSLVKGSYDKRINAFRNVRDQLQKRILNILLLKPSNK